MVYTAGSLALAGLELLVNLPTDRLLGSYVAFRVLLPEAGIEPLSPADLPPSWRADPAPRAVKAIGDAWVRSGRSLVLSVPSAVVPSERNYLIDPQHGDAGRLQGGAPFDPAIDPRLA